MDVNTTNPYESPSANEREIEGSTPHGTSIREEACRGAKFGATLMAIGMSVLTGAAWLSCLGLAVFRWSSTGISPLVQWGGALELMKLLGVSVFTIALTSFYAAIAGALVMAIAAFFRKFRGTVKTCEDLGQTGIRD